MGNFGEGDRFRAEMFQDSNRLRFESPVSEASQRWWLEALYEPFGLTPEGMADLVTKSAPGEKSSAYHYIDASREAFSLRVDGDFPGTREFWYAYRELDLKGGAFNTEGLEISPGMHGEGYGRAIMGDLIDASRLMGIEKIRLRAEDIGIYVWLKMGFLPTSEAWREMRREAFDFILLHRPLLEKERDVTALLTQVMAGGPSMARVLSLIDTEVPSRKIPSLCLSKIKSEHIRDAIRRGLGGKECAPPSSGCAIGARPYPRPSACASHYSSERKISGCGADAPRPGQ
jgi:GNAT superfamily N-acetyltransferase